MPWLFALRTNLPAAGSRSYQHADPDPDGRSFADPDPKHCWKPWNTYGAVVNSWMVWYERPKERDAISTVAISLNQNSGGWLSQDQLPGTGLLDILYNQD